MLVRPRCPVVPAVGPVGGLPAGHQVKEVPDARLTLEPKPDIKSALSSDAILSGNATTSISYFEMLILSGPRTRVSVGN